MKLNKILVLSLFFIALIGGLATIAAVDYVSTSTGTSMSQTTLTIDDIQFNIPQGYVSVENDTDTSAADDLEDVDGTKVDTQLTSEYRSGAGDEIKITVGSLANNQKIESISNTAGTNTTIANKEGFLFKDVDDGKETCIFEYLQDGKIVKIEAFNEDIIAQVIGQ